MHPAWRRLLYRASFLLGIATIGLTLVGGLALLVTTRRFPGLAPDPLVRARSLLRSGKVGRAITEYRAAAVITSDFDGLVELAFAEYLAGDPTAEGEAYQRALLLRPAARGLRVGLGRALAQQGQLEPAAINFNAALALEPENAMAHAGLGRVRLAQGQLQPALASLYRAVELAPDDPSLRGSLGEALLVWGRPEQALEQFETAYRLAPDTELLASVQRARAACRSPDSGR